MEPAAAAEDLTPAVDDDDVEEQPDAPQRGDRLTLIRTVLTSLSPADRLIARKELDSLIMGAAASPPVKPVKQKPYKFLSKIKQTGLQESVVALARLLGKSHSTLLLQDAGASSGLAQSFEPPTPISPTPDTKSAQAPGGRASAGDVSAIESPTITAGGGTSATPVAHEDASPPNDLLTSLLHALATAYACTQDKLESKRLLSVVAPLLTPTQGTEVFGCTHHAWEAARSHAATAGPYAPVPQPVLHRERTSQELENLVASFWRQDRYTVWDGSGGYVLSPGVTMRQVWLDFQAEHPERVSTGRTSFGDKERIGRSAFIERIPKDLRPVAAPRSTKRPRSLPPDEERDTDGGMESSVFVDQEDKEPPKEQSV